MAHASARSGASAKTGARKNRERPDLKPAPAPKTDTSSWADTSWSLLLAALFLTPLLTDNLTWIPGVTGAPWLHSGTGALKAWVLQALVSGALACFAIGLVKGAVSLRWHRAMWLLVAFVGWGAVATATSVAPATSLVGYPQTVAGWMGVATYGVAAFLVLQLAATPTRIRELLRTAALSAGLVALYGLAQSVGVDPLRWAGTPWGESRSFGTIGNPDTFGAFMVLGLFVSLGLLLSESDQRWRLGYGFTTVAIGAATFTSLTRSAWLGAVLGLVVFVVLSVRLKPRLTRLELVLAGVLLAIIATATVASLSKADPDANAAKRVATAFDSTHRNTFGRLETWRVAASGIAQRPLTGWGPDTFPFMFEANKSEAFTRLVSASSLQGDAHSSLVQTASDTGLPGALLWLAALAAVATVSVRMLWSRDKGAAGAERASNAHARAEGARDARVMLAGAWAACAGFFVASLFTPANPSASVLLWCLLGVLLSPVASPVAPRPGLLAWTARVGAAGGALGVILAFALLTADTRAATAASPAVSLPERVAAATAAVRFNPASAEYHSLAARAYAEEAAQAAAAGADRAAVQQSFSRAEGAMRRAVALEPDPQRRSTLVALLLIGGDVVDARYRTEAIREAEAITKAAPYHLPAAYWYARALVASERDEDAVRVLERALGFRADFVDAAVLLSDLYRERGEKVRAIQVLREAIDPSLPDPVLVEGIQRLESEK